MSDQNLPHKPDFLTSAEWQFILARDLNHCALIHECARAGHTTYCSEQIDIDHAQPRELGGDDTVGNVRLLCASRNRGRKFEPLAKWAEPNYWDGHDKFVTGKLREIQRIVGWDEIGDVEHEITAPGNFRRLLLGTVTLLPGATGIGKSLLMQSALFRFNKLIGVNAPRVKHVLWLTNDTTLRDLAHEEIESEAYHDLKMVEKAPVVRKARSFDDLSRGPMGGDVTVSTVQALWDRHDNNGPMRSDDERRIALLHFDTIVFDECDWGNDQVRQISQLARHALQFALTASPLTQETTIDRERVEEFMKRFVLIGPEAIADYQRAVQMDKCLKLLEPATIGPKHTGYDFLKRGQRLSSDQNMPRDHVLYRGLILQAVVEADNLETRMKETHPNQWYSPHIMVRMESIQELLAMKDDLEKHLDNAHAEGTLQNEGWGITAIFMGRQMSKMPPEERDLAAQRPQGHYIHPFMLAKNHDGRAVRGSKRILLMCNIGLRGINNWPISTIVDCTQNESISTLIQFAWGRPIRLPKHLGSWTTDQATDDERAYVTVKVWLPEVEEFESKRNAMEQARKFVVDMLPMVRDAGFMTWSDLINGRRTSDAVVKIDASNRPLTQAERFQIQGALAQAATVAPLTKEIVESTVAQLFPNGSERLRDRGQQYGLRLFENEEFRNHETINTRLEQQISEAPENVMERLHPQNVYDSEDLKRWVRHDPRFKGYTDQYINRITDSDEVVIHSVSTQLRQMQMLNYRPAERAYRLHGTRAEPGVLLQIAGELKSDLGAAGQMPEQDGEVNHAIVGSARKLFDIDNAKEGGPMDHPAYHIAILGRHRRRLQSMARARLINQGQLGEAMKRFATNGKATD